MKEVKKEKVAATMEETARAFLLNAELTEKEIAALEKIGYFTAPASIRHHLNCAGGLVEHSINVTRKMLGLKVFENAASNYRVGMLHDLVKCYCYREKKGGGGYVWRDTGYPGHGVASVMIAADLGIMLTPSERAAITWHMGVFGMDEDELKEYQAATLRYPRPIILTHAADHLASVFESLNAFANEETFDE